MDFLSLTIPAEISWFFNLSILLVSIYVISKINWSGIYNNNVLNIWITAAFCVGLIWMMRATLPSGLNIHFSGAMLMALMFGWRLGVIGMSLICVLVSLWGKSIPVNLGMSLFINAYLSVTLAYLFFLIVEAVLPRNLYIYLFITAFFGSAITFVITGTVSALLLVMFNIFPWTVLLDEYLPFYYLMGFAEAFTTCGLITLFIVYQPGWVYTFRDERYLGK